MRRMSRAGTSRRAGSHLPSYQQVDLTAMVLVVGEALVDPRIAQSGDKAPFGAATPE